MQGEEEGGWWRRSHSSMSVSLKLELETVNFMLHVLDYNLKANPEHGLRRDLELSCLQLSLCTFSHSTALRTLCRLLDEEHLTCSQPQRPESTLPLWLQDPLELQNSDNQSGISCWFCIYISR